MALSDAEKAQLKALQEKEKQTDDEEFVIWVRNGDGHETRLSGDRARAWCRRNGYDVEEAEESTAGDPLEGGESGTGGTGTPPAKKAAPKKAAPKSGETVDAGGELEELETDDKPKPRGPRFF